MLNPDLKDFLIAVVGASASFIGLLFVAISFVMNDEDDEPATRVTKRVLAESSYAALISLFFISLVALIPDTPISYVTIALAWVGLGNSLHFARVIKDREQVQHSMAMLIVSVIVYTLQLLLGIFILFHGDRYYVNNYAYMALVLFLFGMALTRAWELTGIRQYKRK